MYIMDFGHMRVKHRGAKTYTGLDFDVAKSALQKYIRRGNWDKVALIIADIERVSMLDDTDIAEDYVEEMNALPKHGSDYKVKNVQSRAKSMRTNMINRLYVIASEDISIANGNASEHVWKWLGGKKTMDIPLVNMVRAGVYLARSPKLRIISEYKTIHMLPPYYWKSPAQRMKCLQANLELKDLFPFMGPTRDVSWSTALEEGDVHNFFHALGQAMLSTDNPSSVSDRLVGKLPRSALISIYRKMTHAEQPLYLYHAALRHMLRDELEEPDIQMDDIDAAYVEGLQARLAEGEIEIDDFCRDRHTGAGAGCTTEQFAMEGAHVEDLDREHYKWNYHVMYVLFKMVLDDIYKGKTPDVLSKLHGISPEFLDRVAPMPPVLPALDKEDAGPQYQFLVDYYESRGVTVSLAQAEHLFNDGTPTPAPVQPKPRARAKARAKPKARPAPKAPQPEEDIVPVRVRAKAVPRVKECTGDGALKVRIRAKAIPRRKAPSQVKTRVRKTRAPAPEEQGHPEFNVESESAMFTPISRAQIGTGAGKTDVYFAVLNRDFAEWKKGERVVVKGPYRANDRGCQYAAALNEWKEALGLPFIPRIVCAQYAPDQWPDVNGLGVRYGLSGAARQRLYPFMISDDLLAHVDPLPLKQHSSKTWESTTVVDFGHASIKGHHWDMIKHWPGLSREEQARLVAYHVIRHCVGIGDLADRNFLLINGVVFPLDEDAPKKGALSLPGKLLNVRRAALIRKWLDNDVNWEVLSSILRQIERVPPPSPLAFKKISPDRETIINLFQ